MLGRAVHVGLQTWYQPGVKRGKLLDVLDAYHETFGDEMRRAMMADDYDEDEELVDAETLGEAMLRNYVTTYGSEREWEVIHTEQTFQIDIISPVSGRTIAVYLGTWDLLWWSRITKKFWLVDHKTAKTLPNPRPLSINDQAGGYTTFAKPVLVHLGVLQEKDAIEGIVFNYLKKAFADERPRNAAGQATNRPLKIHYVEALGPKGLGIEIPKGATIPELDELATANGLTVLGEPSARQPTPRFLRHPAHRTPAAQARQTRRVIQEARVMRDMLAGRRRPWKNPTYECDRCPFFDVCELHEEGADWRGYREAMFTRRDPYADHREAMERSGVILGESEQYGEPTNKGQVARHRGR